MKLLFAWRYFKSKKKTNAINIIAWISVVAIAVGTAAIIIVLSVFNGFEDLVKSLYADFYADVRIAPVRGKIIHLSSQQIARIKKIEGIDGISLIAEENALLVNGEYQTIVYIKGVDEKYTSVNNIGKHIIRGNFLLGTLSAPMLVAGVGIENAAGLDVEKGISPVTLYLPNRKTTSLTSIDALNSYNVTPSGTFLVQQEFDDKYVFTNLPFLKYMLDMNPDEYSAAEIKVNKNINTGTVTKSLQQLLGNDYSVQTRYEQNQSLLSIMMAEKWWTYAILLLILIVSAFNMIGSLTMLVLEKQKDIAVLKAMGAGDRLVQQIFLTEGWLLALIGGASGIILATLFCIAQVQFKLVKLGNGTFLIDYYPVKMMLSDYILAIVTVAFISLLAAWMPARKAGKQFYSLKS